MNIVYLKEYIKTNYCIRNVFLCLLMNMYKICVFIVIEQIAHTICESNYKL